MKNIILNDRQQLRSGWKLAAYIATFIAIWVAAGVTLSIFFADADLAGNELAVLGLNQIALLIPAVTAPLLMAKFVDHRPLKTFGITFENWSRHLTSGVALAAVMLGVLVAGCYAIGYLYIQWTAWQVPAATLLMTLLVLVLAAAGEELMFRGFPLQVLCEGIGTWPGMLVFSGLFGLLHINNPNASLIGTVNTVIAGIVLSMAYIRSRSLWLPYGIHAGWNIGIGYILGLPLSGFDLASLWTTGVAGSDTILGGAYGPEGGLLTTFIFGTSALIVHRRNWN